MKKLLALATAAGDRLNPVAVKEFRQAVQSRWVIAIVMLFLLVNLSVIGGYLMLSPDADTSIDGGQSVFLGLLSILLITCIGFVPLYTGIRLSMERNDVNIDLFFVTTITSGTIVRGKYMTAMALTLLIFSACMPFMILTYLLRGIDLPTIFTILAFGFVVCAAANALGVFAGSVSGSWLIRGLVDAGVLFILFYMVMGTISMAGTSVMFGMGFMGARYTWIGVGVFLLTEILWIGLLYVLSVALLSPKPSNRMFVPRLYIMGCWAIVGVVMAVWSATEMELWPITAWAVGSGITLIVLLVTTLGERDMWTARVQRTIPRNPVLRPLAFLLYTGSAGGILWCILLFAATMVVVHVCNTVGAGFAGSVELAEACGTMTMVFGYVLCYCLTVAALRPLLFRNVPTVNLSVIAAFLGMAACLAPYLIAFFVERNWWNVLPWYLLGSPMVLGMPNEPAKDAAEVFMLTWLVVCVLASAPWAIGQWRRFVPYQTAVARKDKAVIVAEIAEG